MSNENINIATHFFLLSQFTGCSGHLKGSWVHWTTTNHQVAFFAHDKLWTPHYINPPIYISKWVFWQTSAPQLPKLSGNWGTYMYYPWQKTEKTPDCYGNVLKAMEDGLRHVVFFKKIRSWKVYVCIVSSFEFRRY